MMNPKFFKSKNEFRKWLEKNHGSATELLVGFHKVGSGLPSMTWSESVDQALCFGWIDGIRKNLDKDSYTIRFTPRRSKSTWSSINMKKVEVLTEKKLMRPAGIAAFGKRDESNSAIYAYENRPREFEGEYKKQFKKNKKAWDFFESQAPSYRRVAIYWVTSAKQEVTRLGRLEKLIDASEDGKRV